MTIDRTTLRGFVRCELELAADSLRSSQMTYGEFSTLYGTALHSPAPPLNALTVPERDLLSSRVATAISEFLNENLDEDHWPLSELDGGEFSRVCLDALRVPRHRDHRFHAIVITHSAAS